MLTEATLTFPKLIKTPLLHLLNLGKIKLNHFYPVILVLTFQLD